MGTGPLLGILTPNCAHLKPAALLVPFQPQDHLQEGISLGVRGSWLDLSDLQAQIYQHKAAREQALTLFKVEFFKIFWRF